MPTVMDILSEWAQTPMAAPPVEHLDIRFSVEPHVHLRDKEDGRLRMTLAECAAAHTIVIDIGNTKVEVTSLALVEERDKVVQSYMPPGANLKVYYAPLVGRGGDYNLMRDIRAQHPEQRKALGVKVFFEGVSNAKTAITDVEQIRYTIEGSTDGEGHPTPITWHAECLKDKDGRMIPIKDREYYCVTTQIERALYFNKNAIHIIRHVSDRRTIAWAKNMRAQGFNVHLEVSAQYLLHTSDSIFMADDGSHAVLQCDCVYWPRPKDEADRVALIALILAAPDWVHIGNDFAMHLDDISQESGVKINTQGKAVGGLNFRPKDAKAVVINFAIANRHRIPAGRIQEGLDNLLSNNAARAYGISVPEGTQRYVKKEAVIPSHTFGQTPEGKPVKSRCFLTGHTTHWQLAE